MKNILPDALVNRPDKKGFPTPFAHWLKNELRDYSLDIFHSPSFQQRNIFDPDKVISLYQDHCDGKKDHAWLLWRVLNIEIWQRLFFDDFNTVCPLQFDKTKNCQPDQIKIEEQNTFVHMDNPENLITQTRSV